MSYSFTDPLFVMITTIFFLFSITAVMPLDPKFEACVPRSCGRGPNISYPFWIPLVSRPYCGRSGFEVFCSDDKEPGLVIFEGDHRFEYLIRNVFYANNSLQLVNAEALQDDNCHVPLHNLTLDVSRFSLAHTSVNLFFFYNCTRSVSSDYIFPVTCASKDSGNQLFAVFEHNLNLPNIKYFLETCKWTVSTPVDMSDLIGAGKSYAQFLRRGFMLEWTQNSNCNECKASGGRCGFFKKKLWCFCPYGPSRQRCTADAVGSNTEILGRKLVIGFTSIAMTTLVAMLAYYFRRKLSSNGFMSRNPQNVEAFLRNHGSLVPKRYSYSDIKKVTSSFKEKLGQGGYGSVFKGKLSDGRLVAVKILNAIKGNGEEFINEVASISKTSHVHIVTLLGFCFHGSKRALIYEFMSNGSLEKFIYNKKSEETCPHLGWDKLHQIVVGIAKGLEYLHGGCNTRILHFDIKPHNILLDEDFFPKISDFGLAKLCPKKDSIISMADTRGTIGYIAPEMFSRNFGRVSHKSDVYSYGMMILEMIGGRKNFDKGVDHTSEIFFPDWIYEHIRQSEHLQLDIDMTEEEEEIVRKMALVGLWCIQMNPLHRPSITEVVYMLQGNLESLPIPPKPFLSSPPTHLADFVARSTS